MRVFLVTCLFIFFKFGVIDMNESLYEKLNHFGLLALRSSTAITMIAAHGVPKLMNFSEHSAQFPDPLGIGPSLSMSMAILGEVGCSLAILAGIRVREAALGLMSTMGLIFFVFHRQDAFENKELSFMYLLISLSLAFTGGGIYTLPHFLGRLFRTRSA